MRFLSFLMILAGFALSFGLPIYQSQFSNFEITTQRSYDQTRGTIPFGVALGPIDTPVAVEMTLRPKASTLADGKSLIVMIVATGPSGTAFTSSTSIDQNSPELAGDLSVFTKGFEPFEVTSPGTYDFRVDLISNNGLEAESVDVKLIGRVGQASADFSPIGYALMAVGTVGFLFAGARAKRNGGNRAPSAPQPQRGPWGGKGKTSSIGRRAPEAKKEPEKPKVKWGRGQ